jgi:hypothetical protein
MEVAEWDNNIIHYKPHFVGFEVFTAVTMKNAVFWDATACGCCKNGHFVGTYRLHHRGEKNRRARNATGPYGL